MKPQDNEQLGITKAISAHEQAVAALGDLVDNNPDPLYDELLARLQQNIAALRQMESARA
ncbi:hypothetical protein [Longimicrobium sp.]|jgi:hypothetical protein|uniref:hypothetical protein n=1 Tax=Longimicrobium sp. TaxID=2029185 RepID=UPI002F941BDE